MLMRPRCFTGFVSVYLVLTIVGTLVDKVVGLILAFVMFKALSREARRYMEMRNS